MSQKAFTQGLPALIAITLSSRRTTSCRPGFAPPFEVRVSLVASSTAPSTDWVARLCDVGVDSVSRNLTDGIVRVSGVPGEPAEHEIDLWSIGHVFLEGHRIRVQITSSNFPRWDRNLNTGEPAEVATVMSVADQTVFHDAVRASKIVLPVVPPEGPAR